MANPEHLAILKEGVKAWNRWRKKNPSVMPDLSFADLSSADLSSADLGGARLSNANLSRADLRKADLYEADLQFADLSEANLSWAHLERADLSDADLSKADLSEAQLPEANLFEANLSDAKLCGANLFSANLSLAQLDQTDFAGAIVGWTTFANVDLSGVNGLDSVEHRLSSSVGLDTIYRSKGKIPHVFLRGAGIPENFIEYMASLVGTGIEFYSLFISYSTKDQGFADRLHADLQAKGVRCWFAPHDMRGGKKVHEQIDAAIRVHDKLLLLLSPESMASEWVKAEIFKARERETREGKRVLFPIRLCSFEALRDWVLFDGNTGKDLAREIREYFIPDFSNWKNHDAYKLAFDRLLSDLHGKAAALTA